MRSEDFVNGILGHLDLEAWRSVSPEQLTSDPAMVAGCQRQDAAAHALKYARLAGDLPYDEIGFRWLAATPVKGHVPLQTFAQARLDAERERRRRQPAELDLMLTQARKLRHRPLTIPDGRLNFTIQDDLLNLTVVPEPGQPDDGVVWSFSRAAPPKALLDMAEDSDEPLLLTQYSPENVPPAHWLPLTALIEAGRFGRMQDIAERLVSRTSPGNYYCFVSHRWLTPVTPDPDGEQARLLAWQLVAAMCEAVYVAHERGLHTPRRISTLSPFSVGPYGSDLAEALIVNVLRPALDTAALAATNTEILPLQRETADRGVPAGHADPGLQRLSGLMTAHPRLRFLLDRVYVWYDYSCLPQLPRTPVEQDTFAQAVQRLEIHQFLGRTAILLDDADDYLRRAWCTLEALTADSVHNFDILVGADRPTVFAGSTELYLTNLMADRPHVVWRALLDTELFGVQTSVECLHRLEVAATDPADLPAIYAGLCRLGAPAKIHIDDSEVLTGTLPLPVADGGRAVLLPASSGRVAKPAQRPVSTASLDWTAAMRLDDRNRGSIRQSLVEMGAVAARGCHVVVVGACEGEAVLIADWVLTHAVDLERVVGTPVRSLSWLATDAIPVGHFADGILRTAVIDAPSWVVVAAETRFAQCATTAAVINVVAAAELPYTTVAIGVPQNNVRQHAPAERVDGDRAHRIPSRQARMAEWRGGLFRAHLFDELRRAVAGERS